MAKAVKKVKKTRSVIQHGQVHIFASFNNTIVSVTDEKGAVLTWASGGKVGFKGAREATPYAAQVTAEDAVAKAKTLHGMETVDVFVKGIGVGREQAIRGIIGAGVELKGIFDITPVPHNGARKKKVRKL
ncbi:MAG: 30S ribosomal protein S11 [Candidatus Peribacteria bacterium]|nr:MAG: 30S ribosomal protein S11 [Candidatus Peribacteria bacterium]